MNKFDQLCYTYLIGWTSQDRWYYGYRSQNKKPPREDLWKEYFTSSKVVSAFRLEHGEPDIIVVVKEFETTEEAYTHEKLLIETSGAVRSSRYLNRGSIGGAGPIGVKRPKEVGWAVSVGMKEAGMTHSDATKEKMRQIKLNRTPEQKAASIEKLRTTLLRKKSGNVQPEVSYDDRLEFVDSIRNRPKQRPVGRKKMTQDELIAHRALLSVKYANGGGPGGYRTKDPEATSKKTSEALRGRKKTDAHKESLSKALQGNGKGRTLSDETKLKISEAKTGANRKTKSKEDCEAHSQRMKEIWSKKRAMQIELSASPQFSIEMEASITS
jgi:hypothetical protein